MNVIRSALVALVVLGMAASLLAGELGDKAPALAIKEWVKGKPVDVTSADGKNIYVVEFWATWCLPCHVKSKNVTFIGVSTDDEKSVAKVKPFVEEMGDKMSYTVAIDKDGATSEAYMGANYVATIPHAFIVDQRGRIVWHDFPMADFEKVLQLDPDNEEARKGRDFISKMQDGGDRAPGG